MLSRSDVSDCGLIDCSLPGPSVHEIFQARILEWVAIASSRVSSQLRNRPLVSLRLLLWQVDSLPLHHLGSPLTTIVLYRLFI